MNSVKLQKRADGECLNTKEKEQLKRFKETAKDLECDQSDDALDQAFKKLKPEAEPPPKKKPKKK